MPVLVMKKLDMCSGFWKRGGASFFSGVVYAFMILFEVCGRSRGESKLPSTLQLPHLVASI